MGKQSNMKHKEEIVLLSDEKKIQKKNILESQSQIEQLRNSEFTLKKRIQSLEMSLNTQTKAKVDYNKLRLALEAKLDRISNENSDLLMKLELTNKNTQTMKSQNKNDIQTLQNKITIIEQKN